MKQKSLTFLATMLAALISLNANAATRDLVFEDYCRIN